MDSLSQRAKSIISSIFALVLWAYRLPFRFQKNPQFPILHLGLKTLIFQEATKTPQIIHNKFSPPPSLSSESRSSSLTSSMFSDSFSSWSSTCAMDDLIGTDSGVPIILNDESQDKFGFDMSSCTSHQAKPEQSSRTTTTHRSKNIKKEYPPPIPLHWVLKKHCSSDGRVVLQRERSKRHEYFEARRENGRLVLNLVPLDDAVTCCDEEGDDGSEDDDDECDRDNVGDCKNPVRRSVSFCDDQNMNGHPQMCLVAPLRPMTSVV